MGLDSKNISINRFIPLFAPLAVRILCPMVPMILAISGVEEGPPTGMHQPNKDSFSIRQDSGLFSVI